jgi:hypothetical protein
MPVSPCDFRTPPTLLFGMEQGHPGPERSESLPQPIKGIAWKAQVASVGNASSCVRGDYSWLERVPFGYS